MIRTPLPQFREVVAHLWFLRWSSDVSHWTIYDAPVLTLPTNSLQKLTSKANGASVQVLSAFINRKDVSTDSNEAQQVQR